jgi:uncharacterized protein (TIGR02466 family)
MALTHLFPTLIYQSKLKHPRVSAFNRELEKECLIFRDLDTSGREWSKANYKNGYTSYSTIANLPYQSSTFLELKKFLDGHVNAFSKKLELDLRKQKLVMSTCWMNIMDKGCFHSYHLHPLSVISGTYYVKIPKGGSPLKVEDPRIACFMGSPQRKATATVTNQRYVQLQPNSGDVLLWESWLKHEVPPHLAKENRISISFNYELCEASARD